VIATTNRVLAEMVSEGRFRSDLYYRLNVIPLTLPPLRERAEDIPALARHFAESYAGNSHTVVLSDELLSRLQAHAWPGNVRELSNFVRRIVALNPGGEIGAEVFGREFRARATQILVCRAFRQALRSIRWSENYWS
jgi:DNA-binding NtrC family response regulator